MTFHTFAKVDKATFYRFVQQQSEGRYEYVRGYIMQQQQGGTLKHAQIAKRFLAALDAQVDPSICVANGSDRGVETSVTIRYPDVVVERSGAELQSLATLEPVVVVEVLSPPSEDRDLFVKPSEYLDCDTLEAYVIASQDEAACYVYLRRPDGRFPSDPDLVKGDDKTIDIPALSLSIPLGDIYRGLVPPAAAPQKD